MNENKLIRRITPLSKNPSMSDRPVEEIVEEVKSLETADLFKMSKLVTAEIERRTKGKGAKAPKKTGSMPKGKVPHQLMKPRAWVGFVLNDAHTNGWTPYIVNQTRKNKETGEKEEEEIEMPGSEQNEDGQHVFAGSITEKAPKGKPFIHKDAMSLSKHYFTAKTKEGTRADLYEAFEATYVEEDDTASQASTSSEKVVRISAAEKEAEKLRKAEEKEAEKDRKKQEKEEEKERKKQEKEEEKERKKREKEAEKAAKGKKEVVKAATAAASLKPKTEAKAEAKTEAKAEAKAAVAAAPPMATPPMATPPMATPPPKAKPTPSAPKKKKEAWTCPNDGMVHEFVHEGTTYLRNYDGEIWEDNSGELGDWVGKWNGSEIDTSVSEPQFE